MKRSILITISIVIILLSPKFLIELASPYAKSSILKHIESKYQLKISKSGSAKIIWSPMPYLEIDSVIIKTKADDSILYTQQLIIPFLSVLTKNIKALKLMYGQISLDELSSHITKNNIQIKNSALNIDMYAMRLRSKSLEHLNKFQIDSGTIALSSSKTNASLNLYNGAYHSQIGFVAHNDAVSDLHFSAPGIHMKFNKRSRSGNIILTISNLKSASASLANTLGFWAKHNADDTEKASLQNSPLVLSATITSKNNSSITIGEIKSNNDAILSPSGEIHIENNNISGSLFMEHIDMNKILNNTSAITWQSIIQILQNISSNLYLPKLNSAQSMLNAKIGNITYGDKKIEKINLLITSKGNGFTINNLSFICDKTATSIKGVASNLDYMTKMQGDFKIAKENRDINLSGSFILAPGLLSINNINGQSEFGSLYGSAYKIVVNGNSKPQNEAYIRFKNANFALKEDFSDVIHKLYQADSDKSGDIYFKIFNNHMWLREFNQSWYIDISGENLKIDSIAINKLNLLSKFSNSGIHVEKLYVDSPIINAELEGNFLLQGFKPDVLLAGTVRYMDLTALNEFNPKIISEQYRATNKQKKAQPNDLINTFSITQHDLATNLKFDVIKAGNDMHISNGILQLETQNNLITLKKLRFITAENGIASASGKIAVNENNIEAKLDLILRDIDSQWPFYKVFGINKISGPFSLDSSLSTYGSTYSNMLKHLNGKAKFVGKKVLWQGFDSSELIGSVDSTSSNIKRRITQFNQAIQGGASIFDHISGNDIKIENGVLSTNNINFSNNRLTGGYAVVYRFLDKSISAISKMRFIPKRATQPLSLIMESQGNLPEYQTSYKTEEISEYLSSRKS